jgi:hypothetical protein
MFSLIQIYCLINRIDVFFPEEQSIRRGFGHLNDKLPYIRKLICCLCGRRPMILLKPDDHPSLLGRDVLLDGMCA